jgi:uncharacterized cupin superfamily protein
MTDISTLGHVSPLFEGFASNARERTDVWPYGKPAAKLQIADGEQEAVHDLWAAPGGQADLHVWLAKPGRYDVDGKDRPNFFEVTSLMRGACTVEEPGRDPVDLVAGDTYVMQPGWTGTWVVTDYVEKAFVWVYV